MYNVQYVIFSFGSNMVAVNETSTSKYSTTTISAISNIVNFTTDLALENPINDTHKSHSQSTENVTKQSLNLTKVGSTLLKVTSTPNLYTTSAPTTVTTTEKPFDEFGPPEGLEYIFVPLGVVIFVVVLSAVVSFNHYFIE